MTMDIVTIDFETYYDKDFSLSKMTTESYIRDPRFEIIGVGVKVNHYPTDWYSGDNPGKFLNSLDYRNKAILCHNTAFDGAILSWLFGIKPKLWLDTLSMARPLHNVTVGGSLAKLAAHYGLGKKGDEVVAALGKRKKDFTAADLAQYGEYCKNDVNLTYALWNKMKVGFPASELMVIDQTLRMYTEPVIELDVPLLEKHLEEVRARKAALMQEVDVTTEDIMSNPKFAAALQRLGIEPPRKVSLTTGKETWAFAKTDKGFTDLLEHPDERVQALAAARLGVKSTIEETRTESLIGVAERGRLPIMLNYYGAHTGRFSGGDKLNLQNLPSRGNTTIRRALKAPERQSLIACDSSQIEARMVAWVAGQDDLVQAFREKRDVYSEFASEVYGRTITKADKTERFVGKTCIAEGTLVLSHKGWKPIETVTTGDLLWDGVEWVCHHGLLDNGIKPTLNLCGVWLTPDHLVWSGRQWLEARSVVADEDILYQVLDTGAENLPLQATLLALDEELPRSSCDATATVSSTQSTTIISRISKVLGALFAPKKQRLRNAIGCTAKQWQTMTTGLAYSIVSLRQSLDVTRHLAKRTSTMVNAVSGCAPSGALPEQSSCGTSRPSMDGTIQLSRWIASMWTGTTRRVISASYREAITSTTSAKSQTSKRVYDILNSGSKSRFTVLTDAGPAIVHNCVLGLGYGMGAEKFRRTLEIGQGGISVKIDINEAERIVRLYRQKNWKIVQFWQACGNALRNMLRGVEHELHQQIRYNTEGIRLPNGFYIRYPALRETANGFEYISDARSFQKAQAGEQAAIPWTRIYGGKVTENCIAAGTEVLTDRGWLPIEGVQLTDMVHDGVEFVHHGGTVFKSVQDCVTIDGVWMTPDHEVLTNDGWQAASQNPEPYRPDLRHVDYDQSRTQRWEEKTLEIPVPVWDAVREGRFGSDQGGQARWDTELRVHDQATDLQRQQHSWDVQAPRVCCMAQHVGSLQIAVASSMAKLRRAWDHGVRTVARGIRELLARHGADIPAWAGPQPQGQRWAVQPRELRVGNASHQRYEQAQHRAASGCTGAQCTDRDTEINPVLPTQARPVFDIINAGPRQRFVVRGITGPFIVHNCVQALAALVIREQMAAAGQHFKVAFQVHDEIIVAVPDSRVETAEAKLIEIMSTPPKWAPDLPVACDWGNAKNYGDT